MRVLVAMSGGVDSSVAAALLVEAGHEVVGTTMKLWGGPSDTGCCSVSDVDDARRVAQQLGIDHHVFNFTADFDRHVVTPYADAHAAGATPNPCIECNRHLKFDRLVERADALGFDAVATGHHARVGRSDGRWYLRRGADRAKDQSYVLYMLAAAQLARILLPVGDLDKTAVRARAAAAGLRTAAKPDSQDVCFIPKKGGRAAFLASRIGLHPGRLIDEEGRQIGTVASTELVTVGQRKGLGTAIGNRYVLAVDAPTGEVRVGPPSALLVTRIPLTDLCWVDGPPPRQEVLDVQMSAHGQPVAGWWDGDGAVEMLEPVRRVAPGQSVVVYRGDAVVGGGIVAPG